MSQILLVAFSVNSMVAVAIHTLSLHDALPFSRAKTSEAYEPRPGSSNTWTRSAPYEASSAARGATPDPMTTEDRKSTRLNSSHGCSSYAVFCLKEKYTVFSVLAVSGHSQPNPG